MSIEREKFSSTNDGRGGTRRGETATVTVTATTTTLAQTFRRLYRPRVVGGVSLPTSPRAVDKVVAQVSQPAVSQGFQPARAENIQTTKGRAGLADWKSAIRQVGKPALLLSRSPHCPLSDFVNGPGVQGSSSGNQTAP